MNENVRVTNSCQAFSKSDLGARSEMQGTGNMGKAHEPRTLKKSKTAENVVALDNLGPSNA